MFLNNWLVLFLCITIIYSCKDDPKTVATKAPNKLHKVSEKVRKRNPKPVIVIDAGHGGGDPGGRNDSTGMYEKNFTLPIANAIVARLDTHLFKVIATRTTDIEVDRHLRTARVEPENPNLFISIHCNWAADTLRNGYELIYRDSMLDYVENGDTFNFANPYKTQILSYFDVIKKNMGIYLKNMKYRDTYSHPDRIWVLYGVSFPSMLIEFGYVTGREDYYVLSDPNQLKLFATVVAKSVNEIFKDYNKSAPPIVKAATP